MEKVRTVSDTKREFYHLHTRPINSIYRRVVEELMVELHLLSVNDKFKVDPIYYLGVVSSFERFMQGYRPESDKDSIFKALCQSVGGDSQIYRTQAELSLNVARSFESIEYFLSWLENPEASEQNQVLVESLQAISKKSASHNDQNPQFKYSRMFAIGLYTMLAEINPESLQNQETREKIIAKIAASLPISAARLQKDFDLYQTNLEKMQQMLLVVEDALEAERKKREKKSLEIDSPTNQESE